MLNTVDVKFLKFRFYYIPLKSVLSWWAVNLLVVQLDHVLNSV